VFSERNKDSAISRLFAPEAIKRNTSNSLGVSCANSGGNEGLGVRVVTGASVFSNNPGPS
jgi:hypothetical protein